MCGLVGSLRMDDASGADPALLARMRDSLRHRGPDDCGSYVQGRIGFGFRRLSIIDRAGGHQPMLDADSGTCVVFNGEIYNYRELRAELQLQGATFRTDSDTEVVLKAYGHWGARAAERFVGQFAAAVWTPRSEELLLVRDRLGIKPLYWTRVGGEILFASEIKAFFQHPGFRAEADLDAVSSYLSFRQALWDLCFFKGVHKVLPGRFMRISRRGIGEHSYWELPIPQADEGLREADYLERAEALLVRATQRCMVSDVPLGAYLSGGLDSSILAAILSRHSSGRLRTFSIGYEERGYDEGEQARQVSRHLGTEHVHLLFPKQDYLEEWLRLLRLRDAPLAIPHEVPLHRLSVELKKTVTVAISGEGADELFGGYGRVMRSPMDWKKVALARSLLGDAAARRLGALGAVQDTPLAGLACRSPLEHFFRAYRWIGFEEKWRLLSKDVATATDHDARTIGIFAELFAKLQNADPYDRVFHVFQKLHLGCLLERLDAVSMAAGVEARVPFVDHELVEFVVHMPRRHKLRWKSPLSRLRATTKTAEQVSEWLDVNKYLLRRIGSRLLPAAICQRKKQGFPTPLDAWLRGGLLDAARGLLLERRTRERGLFNPQALRRLLGDGQDLPYDFFGKKVWMLMNVELWFREFIDARPGQG